MFKTHYKHNDVSFQIDETIEQCHLPKVSVWKTQGNGVQLSKFLLQYLWWLNMK